MTNRLTYFLYIGFLYIFIYGPPFRALPVNISTILFFPVLLFYITKKRLTIKKTSAIYPLETALLAMITLYALIVSIYGNLNLAQNFIILTLINIPTILIIITERKNNQKNQFYLELVHTAVLASTITIYLFFFPELNNYIKFSVLKYDEQMMQFQLFRGFGITDELLFSYSIAQSIAFYLCLRIQLSALKKITYLCLIFFSIVINAKIGILFCSLAFAISILDKKTSLKIKLIFLLIPFILTIPLLYLNSDDSLFLTQLISFYNEIMGGGSSDTYESSVQTLLKEMLFLPDKFLSIIFGDGVYLFGLETGKATDSGWILILHFGGILLTLLVLFLLIVIAIRLFYYKEIALAIFLATIFLIANLKGLFFSPKPGMRMFLFVYLFTIYNLYVYRSPKKIFQAFGIRNER